MSLDLVLAALFIIMTGLGWRSGALSQSLRVGAAIAVIFATAPVSAVLRATALANYPAGAALDVASMVLAALLIYLGISLTGWLIIGALHATSALLSRADRTLGLLMGAIKAALLVYVLATCAVLLAGPLQGLDPDDGWHLRDGVATSFVQRYNIIAPWRFPDLARLHASLRVAAFAAQSHDNARALHEHPQAADFLRRDDLRALAADEQLMHDAARDLYALTLAHEAARAALADDDFTAPLRAVPWSALEASLGITPLPLDAPMP